MMAVVFRKDGEAEVLSDREVLRRLDEADRAMIRALAAHGLNVRQAAKEAGYTRNAVYYRLDRIIRRTGLNPRDFYDMEELLRILDREGRDDAEGV